MKNNEKKTLAAGLTLMGMFIIWTILVQTVDVQIAGETAKPVGFATLNLWFHRMTGVHFALYNITDWLGLVPVAVCILFGAVGLVQLFKKKVDSDIIILGIYYVAVILAYLLFEEFPVNYRPVLIDGRTEASYPSSTTLLVLSVMPTLVFQTGRRLKNVTAIKAISILTASFSVFMVTARLISGVHWITDIVGAMLLSAGMFLIYRAAASKFFKMEVRLWNFMKNFRN